MVHWFVYKHFWIVHGSSMTFHSVKIIQSKQVFFSMDGKPSASRVSVIIWPFLEGQKCTNHPIFPWKVRRGSPTRTHQIDGVFFDIFIPSKKTGRSDIFPPKSTQKSGKTEDMLVTRRVCHWNNCQMSKKTRILSIRSWLWKIGISPKKILNNQGLKKKSSKRYWR